MTEGDGVMQDRDLMENMLMLEKGVCDLYLHGAIESSSADVHQTFTGSLDSSLCMQSRIYGAMKDRGWYKPEDAGQQKLQSVKMKFGG